MKQAQAPQVGHYSLSNSDSLLAALFLAAVVHVVIVFGVTFSVPHHPKVKKPLEITLSRAPLQKAPKQAKFLAPDHQLGAGDADRKLDLPKESRPVPGNEQPVAIKQAGVENKPEPKKTPLQKVITKPQAQIKTPVPEESSQPPDETVEEKPKLSAEALQQQIAQLGERIRSSQQSSENAKIKFVNSVSTHKYLAAQYVKDWENKVERTGNLNYPEAARHKGEPQKLTMDIGINPDGSIYSMRIVKSSGNSALDEAAKRIVRMSAPFAELPEELLREVNVLVITRVWKFSDETGMTAR